MIKHCIIPVGLCKYSNPFLEKIVQFLFTYSLLSTPFVPDVQKKIIYLVKAINQLHCNFSIHFISLGKTL